MQTPRGPRHSPYRGGYGGPPQGPPWRQPNWNGEYPARSPIPSPRSRGYPRGSPSYGPPRSSPRPSPRDNGQPLRNHTPSPSHRGRYSMPYDGQGSPYQPNRSMPPRHSTPFAGNSFRDDQSYGSMPDFFTPQSPGHSSANNSAYFTPPETPNTSGSTFNSSTPSGNNSYRGGRQSYDGGRGGQNRRQSNANQNHGGKRRKMDFERTLPGTLLKNSMLDSPWAGIVPTRCPFDGLVMSGGQRHSVLTPGKTAAVAALAEENDAFEGNEEKIDLTD